MSSNDKKVLTALIATSMPEWRYVSEAELSPKLRQPIFALRHPLKRLHRLGYVQIETFTGKPPLWRSTTKGMEFANEDGITGDSE